MRRTLLHILLAATLAACTVADPGPKPGEGGDADITTSDGSGDTTPDESTPDTTTPDVVPDESTPDIEPDESTPDVEPDESTPDAIPDVEPDETTPNADLEVVPDTTDDVNDVGPDVGDDVGDVDDDAAACTEPNCPGAPIPPWNLEDFQPQSPKFQESYGLDAFPGRVVVASLWSGW